MSGKSLLILATVLFTGSIFGQPRVFRFNEIQSRNKKLQWDKPVITEDRLVYIDDNVIDITLDKFYHLIIVNTTFLPNHGAIYLCRDEHQNDITVILVDRNKLFFYDDDKRFQVNFKHSEIAATKAAFADTDD